MAEFKTGDRIRAVRDTSTLGGRPIKEGEQFVVLSTPDGSAYMPVTPSSGAWPARGGRRLGDPAGGRTVSAEDFERVNAPVVDDLWDAKDRVQREVAAEVFTAPAPLDPAGRHEPADALAQAVWEAMLADGAEGHEVFRADKVADAIRAKFVVIDPADVALRTRIAEVGRVQFGGPVEAWSDFASEVVVALANADSEEVMPIHTDLP
jgi:hypothetical protein